MMTKPAVLNVAVFAVTSVLALAAADWIVGRAAHGTRYVEAVRQGVAFDTRSRLEVVLDGRSRNGNWYPSISPRHFVKAQRIPVGSRRVLPLGNAPLAHIVGCNEGGVHSTFRTDELGFRNPPGTWAKIGSAGVFLVGDSFAEGDCVDEGQNIADQMRNAQAGVVNLGRRGSGPLLELATIREYLPVVPKSVVFWLYCEENDLSDLARERDDEILRQYVNRDFSQRLLAAQEEVNGALRAFLEGQIDQGASGRSRLLPHIREAVVNAWSSATGRKAEPAHPATEPVADAEAFLRILEIARRDVADRNGTLVFVYLPHHARFAGGPLSPTAQRKAEVLEGVSRLGIRAIDMEPALRRLADPLSLFPLRMNGHYTAEGYGMVAAKLLAVLDGAELH